ALLAQGASISDARIATQNGDAIEINTIGGFSATGGDGDTARAIVATNAGGNINVDGAGAYTIIGGISTDASADAGSRAGFYAALSSGIGSITLVGTSYSLTGGLSGAGYNSSEMLPRPGGATLFPYTTLFRSALLAQGASISDARIATQNGDAI